MMFAINCQSHIFLRSAFAALALSWLGSCAVFHPKKVDTYEQLMTKLKEGFYSGRFASEDFFFYDLGYPIKTPLQYGLVNRTNAIIRETVKLTAGDLKGIGFTVSSATDDLGNRSMYLNFEFRQDKSTCYKQGELFHLWGKDSADLVQGYHFPPLHGGPRPTIWQVIRPSNGKKFHAEFTFSERINCMQRADFWFTEK
jgi:hypothetical protein